MSCPKKQNGSAVIVVIFVIVAIIVGVVVISLIGTPRFLYPLLSKLPQNSSGANVSANKSWTYIPTIQRGLKYYQGYLPHASQIGGYTPPPADAASQGKLSDISDQLKKIQEDQAQGKEDPGDWNKISELLKDLANQAISNCSKNPSPENIRKFLYIWGLIQLMGNDSLNTQMANAEQDCNPKKEDVYSTYIIDQTNDISNSQDF